MVYVSTITSKRQLTIPASIYRKLDLDKGEKVLISFEKDYLKIQKFNDVLDRLAGSVKIPKKYQDLSTDKIISKTKKEYFKRKK